MTIDLPEGIIKAMDNMDYSKKEIRKSIEKKRSSIDNRCKLRADEQIFSRLTGHNLFKEANSLFIYVSFDGEVDTHRIIDYALEQQKTVCVPKIFTKADGIELMQIDDLSDLAPGYYGILEPPADSKRMSIDDIDIIVMPGLAFDKNGGRIGYGGGFYDRLLAKASKETLAIKVALAYGFQILDRVPTDRWDEKIDMLITDESIINCR